MLEVHSLWTWFGLFLETEFQSAAPCGICGFILAGDDFLNRLHFGQSIGRRKISYEGLSSLLWRNHCGRSLEIAK